MYYLFASPNFSKLTKDHNLLDFVSYLENIEYPSVAINQTLTNTYFSQLKNIYEMGDVTHSESSVFSFMFCINDDGHIDLKALESCLKRIKEIYEDKDKAVPCIFVMPRSGKQDTYRNIFEDIAQISQDIEFERTLQFCTLDYLAEKIGVEATGH